MYRYPCPMIFSYSRSTISKTRCTRVHRPTTISHRIRWIRPWKWTPRLWSTMALIRSRACHNRIFATPGLPVRIVWLITTLPADNMNKRFRDLKIFHLYLFLTLPFSLMAYPFVKWSQYVRRLYYPNIPTPFWESSLFYYFPFNFLFFTSKPLILLLLFLPWARPWSGLEELSAESGTENQP